jgi:uncharacterized protein YprB with RNaseH-like and TPR domain
VQQQMDVYLDIETTGLYPSCHEITVIGMYLDGKDGDRLVQLVGDEATRENLLDALRDAGTIFTYNGSRFDLPFIQERMGVDLAGRFDTWDLMFDCWRNSLYGGLKKVEAQLGICRETKGVNGLEAINLWLQYCKANDEDALKTLLDYNREDLVNLKTLRRVLASKGPR